MSVGVGACITDAHAYTYMVSRCIDEQIIAKIFWFTLLFCHNLSWLWVTMHFSKPNFLCSDSKAWEVDKVASWSHTSQDYERRGSHVFIGCRFYYLWWCRLYIYVCLFFSLLFFGAFLSTVDNNGLSHYTFFSL